MLGGAGPTVKPENPCGAVICPDRGGRFRLRGRPFPPRPVTTVLILLCLAAVAVGLLAYLRRGTTTRQRAVRELLDAADALEARLRTARAEIAAVTGDETEDPVRSAMREMLRQRMWLRDHGQEASLERLAEVRASIDAARARIDQQLSRIDRARTPTP